MKKAGFTLAEVLITLMILGIIAALTIPSLIQNTQKKEQVVQLKKGLSMINQAITMNYALEQKDLTDYTSVAEVIAMLKDRLAVTQSGDAYIRTQDGLTYYVGAAGEVGGECGSSNPVAADGTNACYGIVISTLPFDSATSKTTYADAQGECGDGDDNNLLKGYYQFYAGADRVVPDTTTASVLFAKDATKAEPDDAADEAPAGGGA